MAMEHIKFKNDAQMFLSCDYQMKAKIYIIKHTCATKHYFFQSLTYKYTITETDH
jgi:hypothetical protein